MGQLAAFVYRAVSGQHQIRIEVGDSGSAACFIGQRKSLKNVVDFETFASFLRLT
jgi:hypothetical protein